MSALAAAQPADATRLLYERHSSRIFGFCLSRLGSREEAEDAAQTTFLNAQRGLGRGVVPEYELAWLFKIAQNVCHNRRQSAWRRGRVETVQDLDALQDVIAGPERGGTVSVTELTGALGAIPERQRRALLLREFQGLSYDEIASALGVSVGAVETLLFRARRSVAEELEQAGTARRAGALASIVSVFRWLFQGGAAPLKLAAVATMATTATLAVAPAVRDQGTAPAPAPVSPQVDPSHAARSLGTAVHRFSPVHVTMSGAPSFGPAEATSPPAESGTATTLPVRGNVAPPSSPAQPPARIVTPPTISLPDVTLPAGTTPPAPFVPEVVLPQLKLQLPAVSAPALPEPSKLLP
jgi:RNA polymerase sigma-70 factor (ECF subfamily)